MWANYAIWLLGCLLLGIAGGVIIALLDINKSSRTALLITGAIIGSFNGFFWTLFLFSIGWFS